MFKWAKGYLKAVFAADDVHNEYRLVMSRIGYNRIFSYLIV